MTSKSAFFGAFFIVCIFGVVIFLAVVKWDLSPHIPMLFGCGAASLIAMLEGYSWKIIQEGMVKGITQALEAIIILMLISVLMGVWTNSGVLPAMIYYGLQFISPKFFLVSAMVITSIGSMAIGSWGSAGTLGISFIGMAQILNIPIPVVAGAIISGAYVGDQFSPLSDSTNLTSAVAGINVFDHVRHMFPIIGTAYLISASFYLVLGLKYGTNDPATIINDIGLYTDSLTGAFNITPLLFLPLIILICCIRKKIPAILSVSIGIIVAGVLGILLQGNSIKQLMESALSGYISMTGNSVVDRLLTVGGLNAMMESVSLIIIAMMFGGIMEKTGQMQALVMPILQRVHSLCGLTVAVISTSIICNVLMPDQYIGIALPGRMYSEEYDKHKIDHRKLGAALAAGGVATSSLVPWNTCGNFMAGILGVSAFYYAPYAFFNLILPFLTVLFISAFGRKAEQIT